MSEPETGLLAWLEEVFFGVMELSFLSTPAFAAVALLQSRYPDAVSLSGLAAIGAGSVALAAFRGGRIDVGAWPRRAELSSIPLRFGYFSVVFLTATMGVALAAARTCRLETPPSAPTCALPTITGVVNIHHTYRYGARNRVNIHTGASSACRTT